MSTTTRMSQMLFGERIRALRVLAQKSVEEMAEELGMSPSTYRRLERGETDKIPLEDAIKIGLAHRLSPNEVAALAELWTISESPNDPTPLGREIELLRNRLLQVPPSKRPALVALFHDLTDIELRKVSHPQSEDEEAIAALPEWVRRAADSS